ncbi:cytochrome P450 724B1 [Andrographis paniculata]|uniref:cytochrome P450 724B1 n=1 Tax=Andrographis paniculata TaxID=175694 RepID=UPI0021E80775|nr:cytochrome P450 724B1 [Andrographis paniculata]
MAAFFAMATAGSVLFLTFLLLQIFRSRKAPAALPNGSLWQVPLLGETLQFLNPHKSNNIGGFLQRQCSRYGKVFRSHLFGCPTIVSCDLELNTFVLQNEEKYFQSSYPKPIHDVLGKLSMMLVSGSLHKKLRSVTVGFINASRLDFISSIDSLSAKFVASLRNKNQLLFFKEAKELTFYLMVKVLLSMEAEDPLPKQFFKEFQTFMKGFVSLPINIPGNAYSKAVKARKSISLALKDMIKERENSIDVAKEKVDFLDQLIKNASLNDDERVSLLLDLLLAGYETTSGLMALIVYFLAQSPASYQKLREEHEAIRKQGDRMDWEAYKKMEFTYHVINEGLRCGNLVKFVHRKAIKDVKFKDYMIPEGWQVLPIISATHLDPCLHKYPFEFNPWRWEDTSTVKKVNPFGGGLRVCPGSDLGKLEIAIFLHHFVLNFRWKLLGDDCPMLYPYLDFKKGLPLQVERIKD